MQISAILNVHDNIELIKDTIASIKAYMTHDINLIIDGAFWEDFINVDLPVNKVQGGVHNSNRGPHRNLVFGLMKAYQNNPNADWYCIIEYDCLVASDAFKEDLLYAAHNGVWIMGNDYRPGKLMFPLLEYILGQQILESHYMLGCCNFFHKDFLKRMYNSGFFERFLYINNGLTGGFVPFYEEQGGYSFPEHLFPTLAAVYGGKLAQFAVWDDVNGKWSGSYERYPMRFRPDFEASEGYFPNASIIHPLKEIDNPIRIFHRERRNARV